MALPGAAAKVLHVIGMVGKVEATQNTAIALTAATDGIQLYYKDRTQGTPLSYEYLYDGDMGHNLGTLGRGKRNTPSGIALKGALPFLIRPSGAAYSASVVPSHHTLFKAAGYTASVVVTGGSEAWTYTPTVAGSAVSTLTTEIYTRSQKVIGVGVMGSVKCDAPDLGPPLWMFDYNGIGTLPSDSAMLASIVYPNSAVAPMLAGNALLTIGSLGVSAVVRKSGFDLQRTVSPRLNQSAQGTHAGFAPLDRFPIITATIEQTALTTTPFTTSTLIDPYQLRDVATSFACVLQYGSTQYNRMKINLAQAQLLDWKESNDGSVATIDLTIGGYESTPLAADDHTIVFD